MKRSLGVLLLLGFFVLGGRPAQERPCTAGFETEYGAKRIQLSVPAKVVRRLAENVPIVGQVSRLIKVEITFLQTWTVVNAVCNCLPCCEAPQQQHLAVNISAWAAVRGGTVEWSDALSVTQPGEPAPVDPKSLCIVETPRKEYSAGHTMFGIGLDLPIDFQQAEVTFGVEATLDCKCTTRPECVGNVPPRVLPFGPLELNYGSTVEFVVQALDANGNLELITPGKCEDCLMAEPVGETEGDGHTARQRFRLTYTGEEERIKTRVKIGASDRCGSVTSFTGTVYIFYPPVLRLDPAFTGWDGNQYHILVEVYDPNFQGCPDPWETVRVDVDRDTTSGVGYEWVVDKFIGCNYPLTVKYTASYLVTVTPIPDACPRKVTVVASDSRGLSALPLTVSIPDRVAPVRVEPPSLWLRPGEQASASVECERDPDGDTVTLMKEAGPGHFPTLSGRKSLKGTWEWAVPKGGLWSSPQVVLFKALSPCGATAQAGLVLRILVPPFASDAHAVVPRGGTSLASLYVYDPDTPPERLTFAFDEPPGIRVRVVSLQTPPPYYGSYHGYLAWVEVTAEPTLCDGEYAIPFEVTDSEGLSSRATLYVRVVGNRPPVAEPPVLRGEATVVLTPTPEGVKITPKAVVFQPIQVWDPDGDKVTIEGYGLPPTYAASLSAFLGSLVALYTPGGLTDEDLCYLACKKDVAQDNCTLVLRDSCGATTEVPVIVDVKVEKRPPVILVPAQSKTVECDGKGNIEEFKAWLEGHGGAVAVDACGDVTWSYRIDSFEPTCGGAGRYHVTFFATDCAGNSSPTSADFIIEDTVPPQWDQPMPEDTIVECNAVPAPPKITASDMCRKPSVIFREERIDGPCPYTYTLVRTWEATDGCHTLTHTQRIEVRDTTPPEFTVLPSDVDLGCNPADTSPDTTGWAKARDNCDPNPDVNYTDRVFVVGCRVTIERTWRAVDACGNAATGVQRITYIQDETPPTIHCPGSIVVYVYGCTAPDGTWVSFPITATDDCDPNPKLSCSSWGGWFPVGTTPVTVECTATDSCGNTVTQECSFTVTVVKENRPPVARADSADCNGFCCIPVLANDYDPDGDPITLVEATARCGNAWVSGNMVCYTTAGWACPAPPGLGVTDTITYTITDGCSYATGTVYITLTCTICPLSLPPGGER